MKVRWRDWERTRGAPENIGTDTTWEPDSTVRADAAYAPALARWERAQARQATAVAAGSPSVSIAATTWLVPPDAAEGAPGVLLPLHDAAAAARAQGASEKLSAVNDADVRRRVAQIDALMGASVSGAGVAQASVRVEVMCVRC
jgi:hypothetical protein